MTKPPTPLPYTHSDEPDELDPVYGKEPPYSITVTDAAGKAVTLTRTGGMLSPDYDYPNKAIYRKGKDARYYVYSDGWFWPAEDFKQYWREHHASPIVDEK